MIFKKLDRRSHNGDDDSYFKVFVKEMELKDKVKCRKSEE